jgi:signal transduction histidine kinase
MMLVFIERIRSQHQQQRVEGGAAVLVLVELAATGQLSLPTRAHGLLMREATAEEVARVLPLPASQAPDAAWLATPALRGVALLGRVPQADDALLWQLPRGQRVLARPVQGLVGTSHGPPFPWLPLIVATVVASACAALATQGVARSLRAIRDAAQRAEGQRVFAPLPETGPPEQRAVFAAINAMQRRLAEQVSKRIAMMSAISHDLKTPLARLLYRTDALAPGAQKEGMARDIQAMREMIESAIDYMRTLDDRERLVSLDLRSLIEALVDDAAEAGAQVRWIEPLAGPPAIFGRAGALRRCFANVIGNAVSHGGSATVWMESMVSTVCVVVQDQGPGVPDSELAQLGEPYFRGARARQASAPGHGLGLSIVRNIVEGHGGQLQFANHQPRGFEVRIVLPLLPPSHPPLTSPVV